MPAADIFKFVGLIAFFVIMIVVVVLIWPMIHELFKPGGVDRVTSDIRNAGPWGFLILLAIQFLQIVVAFIPGEVVQVAAGMIYGPWLGALIIWLGCVISSSFIFALVHKLGAPFDANKVPHEVHDSSAIGRPPTSSTSSCSSCSSFRGCPRTCSPTSRRSRTCP